MTLIFDEPTSSPTIPPKVCVPSFRFSPETLNAPPKTEFVIPSPLALEICPTIPPAVSFFAFTKKFASTNAFEMPICGDFSSFPPFEFVVSRPAASPTTPPTKLVPSVVFVVDVFVVGVFVVGGFVNANIPLFWNFLTFTFPPSVLPISPPKYVLAVA